MLRNLGGDDVQYIAFNTDKDKRERFGVSAQQLQEVLPDLVEEGDDGKLKVKYIDLLVREVAKLHDRVKYLESRV